MTNQEIIKYFESIAPERAKWEKKNAYYYSYIERFVEFLTLSGKESRRLKVGDSSFWKEKQSVKDDSLDYVIATDVLGYVDDVEEFMRDAARCLKSDGRIIITQYSALWEPILRLASKVGLRMPYIEQNWLSLVDLENFAYLAGLQVVTSGRKMLMPKYIPLLSPFMNKVLVNLFPFSHLGLFHYLVIRKTGTPNYPSEPSLSIIVPARNEKGTIEKIVQSLPTLGSFTEIVFVEGGSKDGTFEEIVRIAEKYQSTKRIIFAKQEGRGKGDAVRNGFEMAKGDVLAIYDADMTVPAETIEKFYRAIVENKGEFINGSRLVYPLQKDSMRLLNFFANKFFGLSFSAILGQTLKDTLCGTKVLWKKDYENIKKNRAFFGEFDPFGDFDLLFGAAKLNLKIIDLPIRYHERVYGDTNINRWRHGWLLLKMMLFAARKIKFI